MLVSGGIGVSPKIEIDRDSCLLSLFLQSLKLLRASNMQPYVVFLRPPAENEDVSVFVVFASWSCASSPFEDGCYAGWTYYLSTTPILFPRLDGRLCIADQELRPWDVLEAI